MMRSDRSRRRTAITFDTYAYIKQLTEQGFSEKQAVSVVNMVRDAQDNDVSHLVTKEEFTTFKSDLKADLANFATKADLKADLADLKAELIKWMLGMSFAQVALILTVLKLMR